MIARQFPFGLSTNRAFVSDYPVQEPSAIRPGWVYILTNPAMPNMVKIGFTTRSLEARADELTAATGVPLPFVVAWGRAVSDCAYVEKGRASDAR